MSEEEQENFPIAYSIDNAILMHRDAHFSGNFNVMLDYYKSDGKGVNKDFEISRIQELADLENKIGNNLAAVMLSGSEAEKIAEAKLAYKRLKDLYDIKDPKNKHPLLIADLILSEDEEGEREVEAIIAEKGEIVPSLITLLKNEDFYDPLFPGYGQAPMLAAKCLGLIGDKRAIISLFEAIGEGDFFNEDMILKALHAVGAPAKNFLIKVLQGRPLNYDNERAAIALVSFKNDSEVQHVALKMLFEIDLSKDTLLATYLILICEGLQDKEHRQKLASLATKSSTPLAIKQDIQILCNTWE